jgi:hypothetical protein
LREFLTLPLKVAPDSSVRGRRLTPHLPSVHTQSARSSHTLKVHQGIRSGRNHTFRTSQIPSAASPAPSGRVFRRFPSPGPPRSAPSPSLLHPVLGPFSTPVRPPLPSRPAPAPPSSQHLIFHHSVSEAERSSRSNQPFSSWSHCAFHGHRGAITRPSELHLPPSQAPNPGISLVLSSHDDKLPLGTTA